MDAKSSDRITEQLTLPVSKTSGLFYLVVVVLFCTVAWGAFAWIYQLVNGLTVTGLNTSVVWGVYITNFVFFIGISLAGTFISAVLLLVKAEWRRPISRAAEVVTVFALILAVFSLVADMGHPERFLNLIRYGRVNSPLIWDAVVITLYFLSSLFYLYLAMLPDLALLRDISHEGSARNKLYSFLARGWKGGVEQEKRLKRVLGGIMAVLIIPIAIMVHTVTAWIFGMTVRPMWHSTILGPYFVVTAIFSGIAVILIALAVMRNIFNFKNYLKPVHFDNLGKLLIVMGLVWLYFTFSEYLTTGYGALGEELDVFHSKISGEFSTIFWVMIGCVMLSLLILLFRKISVIGATVIASLLVVVSVWLERFLIVVPTLMRGAEQGYKAGVYHPTWVEWSIMIGSVAAFTLFYVIFAKLFPIISIWEVKEGKEAISQATERMETYLPAEVG